MRKLLALLAFLIPALAHAQTYSFDPDVNDTAFRQAVREAAAQWSAAAPEVNLEEAATNGQLNFDLVSDEQMGPDTLSLTLLREGGQLDVLVKEGSEQQQVALLHEFGLLLGLGPRDEGIMSQAIAAGQPARLDDATLAQLAAVGGNPADLNNDGTVDVLDLALLARHYGETGINITGDINRDGAVDDADLRLLREAYVFEGAREQAEEGAP